MAVQLSCAEVVDLCRSADPAPLLLDVREPWEAQLASIRLPGVRSLLMPMGELLQRYAQELDPAQPVVAYCHHGVRSLQVVAFLERRGFDSVYNLAGGIDAWSSEIDASVPRY